MIDRQKWFDDGWRHFDSPEKFSLDNTGDSIVCLYRDARGNRCIVGLQIPDDKYNPEIDEDTIAAPTIAERYYKNLWGYEPRDGDFLTQLQRCHDWAAVQQSVVEFRERMRLVAEEFNLTIPE